MSNCAHCKQFILFGGIKHGSMRFCSKKCFEAAKIPRAALNIPDDDVHEIVEQFHQGDCPVCAGPGPVDIHESYRVVSLLVLTRFETIPLISCRRCATMAKIKNTFITGLFGWWGVPFGIILTPIFLARNFFGFLFPVSAYEPSARLKDHIKLTLVDQHLRQMSAQENVSDPNNRLLE